MSEKKNENTRKTQKKATDKANIFQTSLNITGSNWFHRGGGGTVVKYCSKKLENTELILYLL